MDRPVIDLPIEQLTPAPWNPNEMSEEMFNQLVKNIQEVGLIQPIMVAKIGENEYQIIGGEHRWKAARFLNYPAVPCIVYEDWDEDKRKFVNMRMNVITGKISPAKFTAMHTQMRGRYSQEIMATMMGFASEEEMKKLIKDAGRGLTPDQRRALQRDQREIRNVRDLSDALNRIMRDHGNTLEHGFLFFVQGGQTHLMVQMDAGLKRVMQSVADRCVREGLEIADVIVTHLLRMEASVVAGEETPQLGQEILTTVIIN